MNLWNSCDLPVSTALELDSFPAKARCGASGHDARCRGSPCSRGPAKVRCDTLPRKKKT